MTVILEAAKPSSGIHYSIRLIIILDVRVKPEHDSKKRKVEMIV